MQGTLADLDLASLALATSLGRSSLRLEVSDPSGALVGQLVLKAGHVVSATGGGVRGHSAMHRIMSAAATSRFQLVQEPLDYALTSALASVEELGQIARHVEAAEPDRRREVQVADVVPTTAAPSLSSSAVTSTMIMQGALADFDVATLLQTVACGRQHTALEIFENGQLAGSIEIKANTIVAAVAGARTAKAAVRYLIGLGEPHRFCLNRLTGGIGDRAPLGSIHHVLLHLGPATDAAEERTAPARPLVDASSPPAEEPTAPARPLLDASSPPSGPVEARSAPAVVDASMQVAAASERPVLADAPRIAPQAVPIMEGSLEDFDLVTLLETLTLTRQHAQLQILDRHHALIGEIQLKAGMIVLIRATARHGAEALAWLSKAPSSSRFRMMTGFRTSGAPPLGTLRELLAVAAAATARQRSQRAGRILRIAIPLSFFLGGAVVFFVARGTTATSHAERDPVVRMTELPPDERPAPPPAITSPAAATGSDTATPRSAGSAAPASPDEAGLRTEDIVAHTHAITPRHPAPPRSLQMAQRALKQLGFDPGAIDNTYSVRTRRALREFQRSVALPQSGTLDDATWAALAARTTN